MQVLRKYIITMKSQNFILVNIYGFTLYSTQEIFLSIILKCISKSNFKIKISNYQNRELIFGTPLRKIVKFTNIIHKTVTFNGQEQWRVYTDMSCQIPARQFGHIWRLHHLFTLYNPITVILALKSSLNLFSFFRS